MKISPEKAYIVIGRAIEAAGSLFFLKMLLVTATADDVGIYMLSSSILALLLTATFSSLDQGLLRNLPEYREQKSLAERYSAMLLAYLLLAIALSSSSYLALWLINFNSKLNLIAIPLSIWFICESLKNLNAIVASGRRDRALIARASLLDYSFRLILIYMAHLMGSVTPVIVIYLLAISGAGATALMIYAQRSLLSCFSLAIAIRTLRDSLVFSWPLIVWGVFGWLQNMSGRWILDHFTDLSTVATYGTLTAIGTFPVTAVQGVVVAYFVPVLYERETLSPGVGRVLVRRVALGLLPVFGVMVLILAVWHEEFVSIFAHDVYQEYSFVLPLIIGGASVSAIASILTYAVYAQRRVVALLFANTFPGLIALLLGYFFIARWGFYGAIFTLVSSQLLIAAMYLFAFVRAGRSHCSPVACV